jgi:hypothetical protein
VKVVRCSVVLAFLQAAGLAIALGAGEPKAAAASLYSLRAATIQAFTRYSANVELQNARTLREGPFLWIDGLNSEDRKEALTKLRAGQVQVRRLSTKTQGRDPDVPGGLIHDWEGIVFIPGAQLDSVLQVLEDYDHHATYFAPDVEKSRIESHNGDHYRVFLRFRRQKVVTVILDTEHDVHYFRDSPVLAHSRSSAIRIVQVENPGEADEKEKAPGDDDGFLWRMETWWRLEEKDGGVYVQNEAVTLTRDIPTGLGWLIEPFITNIPKETLEFTLQALRKAVVNQTRH